MNKLIIALTLCTFFILSCTDQKKTPEQSSTSSDNLAINQLEALEDSCTKAWNMMISSDDQKIKDIQRLLLEISYVPTHNEAAVKRLSDQVKELTSLRYTQETLTSDKIDVYDQATDSLLKAVFELKRNTKGVEQYTLTEELEKSIREADGKVINYRVLYDTWVKKYNATLETTKNSNGQKKTTFQL